MNLELTEDQKRKLMQLHRFCKQRRFADKIKSVLLLDKGFSCEQVAAILLLDDDTVRIYRNQYLNHGAESLLTDGNKGTTSNLTDEQITLLNKHLSENTYADSKGIVDWISNEFSVKYTSSGIAALLKRMGFVYKKPVLTPCKADPEKQEKFVKEYIALKENLEEHDAIYFMDGVHPQHNATANYGWIKKGETKYLRSNNGRKRTKINTLRV